MGEKNDSESDSESDVEYEDEDGLIGNDPLPPVPIVAYDRDDPPMSVGSVYPNMKQFKLALNQHAIKHEFEYLTKKSDPGRVRAYCSKKVEEGCRWRLHARTKEDKSLKVTIIIIADFVSCRSCPLQFFFCCLIILLIS